MKAFRSVCVFLALLAAVIRLSAQQIPFEKIKAKAEKGDLPAQVDAGEYFAKRGKDSEAFPWFMKAAIQGSPAAQLRLAEFYELGRGVAKDDAESQKSVPEVSAKLKALETKERKFEEVVKSAEQAAVLVLVY